jgi:uncharacterized OB-fold protein
MDLAERKDHVFTTGQWPLSSYRWKMDRVLDRYVEGLKEKKILGLRCANCGTIYVPPMNICSRCHSRLRSDRDEDWLRVSERGTVITYTVSYTEVAPGGLREVPPEERRIFVVVQLDGADTHVLLQLKGCPEEEVKVGMRVQAGWAEETSGALSDLVCFNPVR